MKKIICVTIYIFIISFISCNSIEYSGNNYEFIGTWKVNEYQFLDEQVVEKQEKTSQYLGGKVIFSNSEISILNEGKTNINYRLKVVDRNYKLAEEYNLTMDRFLNDVEKKDIISIVDNDQIIAEFFTVNDNEMILLYKSILLKLYKISDHIEREELNSNVVNENYNNESLNKEGIMLGIKIPRKLNDDGTYSSDEYKTIWISHDDSEIGNIYLKEEIIFPRMTGIFKLRINKSAKEDKIIENFQLAHVESDYQEDNVKEEDLILNESLLKSIKFIGNDYIAIEKYSGNNFRGNYPIYEIVPVNNLNDIALQIDNGGYEKTQFYSYNSSDNIGIQIGNEVNSELKLNIYNGSKGVQISDIFTEDAKSKYLSDFKEAVNSLTVEEINTLNINNIDYSNLAMERSNGKWVLISQIMPKVNENKGYDFKLSLAPNKKLINYNYLNIPLKLLKSEFGYFKDAFTSPEGKMALIQFSDYIAIYKIENGTIISSPLEIIDIPEEAEIIMSEWCSGSYVEQWEKVFLEGYQIK